MEDKVKATILFMDKRIEREFPTQARAEKWLCNQNMKKYYGYAENGLFAISKA